MHNEYKERRQKLALNLAPDSLAIIPAAKEVSRNADTHYRFRQDSDFYYLSGCNEPGALLVITAGKQSKSYLFNLPKDPLQELWTGWRLGQEQAKKELGVDEAYPITDLEKILPEIMQNKKAIYYNIGRFPQWEKKVFSVWEGLKKQIRRGIKAPESFFDLAPLLGEMRLFKSATEIATMQKGADISVNAHINAMRAAKKAKFEYELEAELLYTFTQGGCRSVAYDSIVASGENACTLHYTQNDKPLAEKELILIDAGGEYGNYASDITRTFPKNGKFTPEQKDLYELVLAAQQAGIACIRPGTPWNEIQKNMVAILTAGLVDLKILKGNIADLIEKEAYKAFYMHNPGHWLGLDVHDVGNYKINDQWRLLEPGMVLTVEPGLYIRKDIADVPEPYRGIGIRIEDDILVTPNGNKNLTGALPAKVGDIEAIVCGH